MDDTELITSIDQKMEDASLDQETEDDASAANPAPTARTAPLSSDDTESNHHEIKTISANPNNYDAYVQVRIIIIIKCLSTFPFCSLRI